MVRSFKLVQITDLHLRADPNAEMGGKNVMRHIDAVFDVLVNHPLWPADLVAITGDIADEISAENFQVVYRQLAEKLARLNTKVCSVPGNHDHGSILNEIFSKQGIQTTGTIQLGNWKILLLDSSVPGSVAGNLDDTQLLTLENQLEQTQTKHLAVLIHHPIVDINCQWLDEMRVANGEWLIEKLSGWPGQKLVLWGHAHQEFDEVQNGVRLLGSPAACPVQFLPLSKEFAVDGNKSSGFRWCTFSDDGSISTQITRI